MKRHLHTLMRVGLGAVFLYAGTLKVADPQAFADSIASFRLLPAVAITPLALALPMYEILLGALLVGNRGARPAALGVLGLCAIFALALGSALFRGITVDCGCFGRGAWSANPWFLLGRDVALGVVSWVVYRANRA